MCYLFIRWQYLFAKICSQGQNLIKKFKVACRISYKLRWQDEREIFHKPQILQEIIANYFGKYDEIQVKYCKKEEKVNLARIFEIQKFIIYRFS